MRRSSPPGDPRANSQPSTYGPVSGTHKVPIILDVLDAFGIAAVGADEHEADDVIATLAERATVPVDVVTGDRDLFQLIDDDRDVRVLYTARGVTKLEVMDAAALRARYGIAPAQYADFATLRGDPSDGLPGVPGIGTSGLGVPLPGYQHVDDLAELIDRAVDVAPLASHLHIGLVHLPAVTDGVAAWPSGVGQQRREAQHPPIDRHVVDLHAPLAKEFLHIAVRQTEAQVPADRQHDHIGREAEASEGGARRDRPMEAASGSHGRSLTAGPPHGQRNRA
jgi:5'-3' exonuclease, N-terminal resolvase-like domain